jgi:hypothetical protein
MANNDSDEDLDSIVESVRSAAIDGILRTIHLDGTRECHDFEAYLVRLRSRVVREANQQLRQLNGIKLQVKIVAEYTKPPVVQQAGGALERARRAAIRRKYEETEKDKNVATIGLSTKLTPLTNINDVRPIVERLLGELRQRHIDSIQNGSGFILHAIISADLNIAKHTPLDGRSFIPLPDFLERKHCIINVKNKDNRCFGYALLAALHSPAHGQHPGRAALYNRYFAQYGLDNIEYPVKLEDLEAIERQIDIPFNVYTFFDDEGKGRKPLFTSRVGDPQNAIDILYWKLDDVTHYAWIKNFNGFVYDIAKRSAGRCFWCKRCFCHFALETAFNKHTERCMGIDGFKCIHKLPSEGTVLEFKNVKFEERVPFVIYADFECLTTQIIPPQNESNQGATEDDDDSDNEQSTQDSDQSIANISMYERSIEDTMTVEPEAHDATVEAETHDEDDSATPANAKRIPKGAYQEHKPISIGLKMVSAVPGILDNMPYETYTGADVAEWLLQRLLQYQEMCVKYLFDEKRMIMTAIDHAAHAAARTCYICEKPFSNSNRRGDQKVRDHDHISGAYRGAAHSTCNLLKRRQRKIPVFFHNFRGYDSHLIISALGNHKDHELKVIAQTMEKYLQLQFSDHIVYKDSLQFLSCSLERLTANLLSSGRQCFVTMTNEFRGQSEANIDLLLRKGIYPYDYMDNDTKFVETQLPPRAEFFSRLRQSECSPEDYEHAQHVWKAFGCKTMKDYHDLYLKCDVLQLVDVFETFRSTALGEYHLDPAHYVSAPHLSWDAMLRTTRCKLDLLSDDAMFTMIHQNLRGGVAMISKRLGNANNKYMNRHYDPNQPSKYLLYIDANNLYGWSLSQPLPDSKFEWMSETEWQNIDWLAQSDNQETGYIVECDFSYPDELHDTHSDYPLAPERLVVETAMLSDAQRQQKAAYFTKFGTVKYSKLIPNLFTKRKYACHYMNLRFYLEHGLVLTKIHRVLRFHQSRWLAQYIAKNSELRCKARNDFEKDFYKLMNNAVYGKTCENVLKRQDIHLVTDTAKTKKLIDKPHCIGYRIFTRDIAAVAMQKLAAEVNKPTYVGLAVLEYAKLHMYRFHYDQALKHWPNGRARLILTDTDSLLYEIATDDVYADIQNTPELHDWFDLSNYPRNNPLYSATNKMVVGKMKDEMAGKSMCQCVGLRAKMYSFKVYDPITDTFSVTKKAKGIQKAAMETVTHEQYLKQLRDPEEHHVIMHRIGQVLHTVLSFEQQKRALCAFDDKRYLLADCMDTLAHGHYKIRNNGGQQLVGPGDAHPTPPSTSTFTDEDGDAHLVVTAVAATQSPVLQQMFANDGDIDNDDNGGGDNGTVPKRPHAAEQQAQVTPKRSCNSTPTIHQQVVVNPDEMSAAKDALRKTVNEMDFEIADYLISAALASGIDRPTDNIDTLKDMLQNRSDMDATCALNLLDQAHRSNKMTSLSTEEQLLFILIKSTKVFRMSLYTMNPHKALFMLLTGRSSNWWDNNHTRTLRSIATHL